MSGGKQWAASPIRTTPCLRPQAVSGCFDDDNNLVMEANRGKAARLADSVGGAMLPLLLTAERDCPMDLVFLASLLHRMVTSLYRELLLYSCAGDNSGRPELEGRAATSFWRPLLSSQILPSLAPGTIPPLPLALLTIRSCKAPHHCG